MARFDAGKDLVSIRITAEDDTKSAFDSMKRNIVEASGQVDRLKGSFGSLKGLLAGIGLTGASAGLLAWVESAIQARAALDDLSEMTSLTVETLSSLSQVARIGGHSLENVQTIASKFAKSAAEAAGGNKDLVRTFEAMGISLQRLRSAKFDDLFVEFARKIANAENRTYAIAYATDLAGKSAATAIPFFRDLSEEGLRQALTTTEQAAAAEKLTKEWRRLGDEGERFKNEMATGIVPTMQKYLEQLNEASRRSGGLFGAVRNYAGQLGGTLPEVLGGSIRDTIRDMDAQLERLQGARQLRLNRGQSAGTYESQIAELTKQRAFAQWRERQEALALLPGSGRTDARDLGPEGGYWLPPPPEKGGAGGADSPYRSLLKMLEQEAQIKKEVTAYDKLLLELGHMKADQLAKLAPAEIEQLKRRAEEVTQIQLQRRALENWTKAAEEADKTQERQNQQIADFNTSVSEVIQNLRFETEWLGKSNAERDVAAALRRLDADLAKAQIGLTDEQIRQLEKIYRLRYDQLAIATRENAEAKARGEADKQNAALAERAAEDSKRLWESTANNIENALVNGIERSFERGEGFARTFGESLKNYFRHLAISIPMRFVANGATGALAGLGLLPGAASASGGGGGGGGGILDMLSSGNSLTNVLGIGGGSGVYGVPGISGLTQLVGGGAYASTLATETAAGIGGFEATLAATEAAGATVGAGALGAVGAAIPYVGLALAAYSLLSSGSHKKPAQLTGIDMAGLISRSGLSGSAFYGNDSTQGYRWGFEPGPVGASFDPMVKQLFDQMEAIGKSLGRDTSFLDTFSAPFSASGLSGGTPDNYAREMAQQLGQVSDVIARQLLPNLDALAQAGETATQTLMRVAQEQQQLLDAQKQAEAALGAFAHDLPGKLGITGLTDARSSLAVSSYVAPLARFAEAREQLNAMYSRAIGGDLDAAGAFPNVLQQALGIGRDVFASGPQFADLFTSGNRMLNDLLSKQQQIQVDLTRGLSTTIVEGTQNTVKTLEEGFERLDDSLQQINRRLQAIGG